MNAVTLAYVRTWMGTPAVETANDPRLNQLIPAVSRAIEHFLGRELEAKERTEVYRVSRLRSRSLTLRQAPVVAGEPFELKVSDTAEWDDTTAEDEDEYLVDEAQGLVRFDRRGGLVLGPTFAQVVYTAGLGANEAALAAAFPDVTQAAALWVAEVFKRRESLSKTGQSSGGPSVQWVAELGMPKVVRGLLEPYRRVRLRAA